MNTDRWRITAGTVLVLLVVGAAVTALFLKLNASPVDVVRTDTEEAQIAERVSSSTTAEVVPEQPTSIPTNDDVASEQQRPERNVNEIEGSKEALAAARKAILEGPYGKMPIEQVVDALMEAQGSELQTVYLALALRKEDALPVIDDKLRNGLPQEKRMITKLLRYVGWPEAVPTLVGIIGSEEEHWLSRTGSLYALGAIGDKSAGPYVADVLEMPEYNTTEKRIATATLARLGYRDAIPVIAQYLDHESVLVRIYAIRALAELGENPNTQELFDALRNDDYVIRQEASAALGLYGGDDAAAALEKVAETDFHRAVRQEAQVALYRLQLASMPEPERVQFLEQLLSDPADRVNSWALSVLATDCGTAGQEVLRKRATERSRIGRRSVVYLIASDKAGPYFRGVY